MEATGEAGAIISAHLWLRVLLRLRTIPNFTWSVPSKGYKGLDRVLNLSCTFSIFSPFYPSSTSCPCPLICLPAPKAPHLVVQLHRAGACEVLLPCYVAELRKKGPGKGRER